MLHRSFARGQRLESQPCMQYATRASMRSLGLAGCLPANSRRDCTGSGSVITDTPGTDSVLSGVIKGGCQVAGCQVARTRATLSHLVGSLCFFQTFFMCSYILQYIAFYFFSYASTSRSHTHICQHIAFNLNTMQCNFFIGICKHIAFHCNTFHHILSTSRM